MGLTGIETEKAGFPIAAIYVISGVNRREHLPT
jgi:hypothetical protein